MDEHQVEPAEIAATLGAVSALLAQFDWDQMVGDLDRAETLGPMLDPTAFRDSIDNGTLNRNRRIAVATRDYVAVLRQIELEQSS